MIEKVIARYIPKNTRCRFEEQKNEMLREKEKGIILQSMEKVNNPASISLTADFVQQEPDMSVCRICKEVIYGVNYRLEYKLNGGLIYQDRPVNLCKPCYLNTNER